jgi:hypothetical protein
VAAECFAVKASGNPASNETNGFSGRPFQICSVNPRTLLPQIHLHILIRIETRTFGDSPEGIKVEFRRAGSNDQTVKLFAPYVIDDFLL